MADDEAKLLADAKKLPLEERASHPNWKVRSEAFEDIKTSCTKAFSTDDPIFDQSGMLYILMTSGNGETKGASNPRPQLDDLTDIHRFPFTHIHPSHSLTGHVFSKGAGDTNANVMDKALDALCTYLTKSNEDQASKIAGPVCSTITAKCLKSRPATLSKATKACLLFIELEQQEAVIENACKGFSDKVPKAAVAALDIVFQAISQFGCGQHTIDPKPVIKSLPPIFAHSNVGVREKAKDITVAIASFLGPAIVQGSLMEKMNDAMKKDVEGAIQKAGRKQPERLTRRAAAEKSAAAGNDDDGPTDMDIDDNSTTAGIDTASNNDVSFDADMDAYDFSDPVDIMGPLSKEKLVVGDDSVAFWECFESKKWNIRRAALDKVRDAAKKNPRLSGTADYNGIVAEMKKILAKDANINCAAGAAEAAGALAKGLRKDFSSQARTLCPVLLERLKEKNIVMSKAAVEALYSLSKFCYSLSDVAEELATAMAHKNPKARLETLKLLKGMLQDSPKPVVVRVKDVLLTPAATLAMEADSSIREAAQAVLVMFAVKAGGMSILDKVVDKMDDSRKKKIEEMVQEAAKDGGGNNGGGAGKRAAAAAVPRSSTGAGMKNNPCPSGSSSAAASNLSNNSSSVQSRPPAPSIRPGGGGGGGGRASGNRGPAAATAAVMMEEDYEGALTAGRLSPDESEAKLAQFVGAGAVEALKSIKWQDRLEAMTSIVSAADAAGAGVDPTLCQAISCLPGWGDKNFQVINKMFGLVDKIAVNTPCFSKRDGIAALEGLADKIHEVKHKLPVYTALTSISEAVGPQFVASQLHRRAAENKNPKVLSESLGWLAEAVTDFGLGALDARTVITWMKADLGSANPVVREKAMTVLGRCHAQLGPGLVNMLDGLKPAQLSALDEVFRKNPHAPTAPSRKARNAGAARGGRGRTSVAGGGIGGGEQAAATSSVGEEAAVGVMDDDAGGAGGGRMVSMDDLLPRVDISSQVTTSLIASISNSNWKTRNAALDELENILKEAGGRIAGTVNPELFPALRGRMADTNRNLAAKTLLLLGKFASAMGPAFDKAASRVILMPSLGALSDNKKQVRDAVVVMLDAWISVSPADRLLPSIADTLINPKCLADGKIAALQWMAKVVKDPSKEKGFRKCTDSVLKACSNASTDKAVAVRDAGALLLTELLGAVGQEGVLSAASSLEGSSKKVATEMIAKMLGSMPPPAAVAVASSSAAAGARQQQQLLQLNAPKSATKPGASLQSTSTTAAEEIPGTAGGESSGRLLLIGSGKQDRARKYRPRHGRFEGVAPDEVEILQSLLPPLTSEPLRSQLFSKDFKDHIQAADILLLNLPQYFAEVQASLDLLLRWFVVRICDGNSQTLSKVLETARALMEALSDSGYQMTETEAVFFLPCVIEKAGHPQDRVRQLHRELLRLVSTTSLHPAHKVLDYMTTHGLESKNARTRIEACEFISELVEKEGSGPVLAARSKPMQSVATLLKERDGNIRSAALACIEVVWVEENTEGLWKLLGGKLEPRENDLVEEKLKRSTKQPKPPRSSVGLGAGGGGITAVAVSASPMQSQHYQPSPGVSSSMMDNNMQSRLPNPPPPSAAPSITLSSAPTPVPPPRSSTILPAAVGTATTPTSALFSSSSSQQEQEQQERERIPRPKNIPDDPDFPARWEEHMSGAESNSLPMAIEAMKQLCADIMVATEGRASLKMRALIGSSAERLFTAVTEQLRRVFTAAKEAADAGQVPPARGCKYALNVLLQAMGVPEAAQALPQAPLRDTVSLLLVKLLNDNSLLIFEEGPTLVKAVNVLMLKMLEASNRTYAFSALLHMLRDPPLEVSTETVSKFNDLVVKCLIKLTKSLQFSMDGVYLPALLMSIHAFFLNLGVDEIRKRSSADDKPLRMVKTILHELCKLRGYAIYDDASGIPGADAESTPMLFVYIKLNLQSLAESGYPGLVGTAPPPLKGSSSFPATSTAAAGGDGGGGGSHTYAASPKFVASSNSSMSIHASSTTTMNGQQHTDENSPAAVANVVHAAMTEAQKTEVKARLKEIMTSLVHKDQSNAAMRELHGLRTEYPQYVDKYIAGTSDMFRAYISQGLQALNDKEHHHHHHHRQPQSLGVGEVERSRGSLTEGTSRLSGLRERMSMAKTQADSSAGMKSSMEDLQQRMANLRKR